MKSLTGPAASRSKSITALQDVAQRVAAGADRIGRDQPRHQIHRHEGRRIVERPAPGQPVERPALERAEARRARHPPPEVLERRPRRLAAAASPCHGRRPPRSSRPAEVPEIASTSIHGSSSSRSSTPQVKAPCDPPPCSARSTSSGSRRAGPGAGHVSAFPRRMLRLRENRPAGAQPPNYALLHPRCQPTRAVSPGSAGAMTTHEATDGGSRACPRAQPRRRCRRRAASGWCQSNAGAARRPGSSGLVPRATAGAKGTARTRTGTPACPSPQAPRARRRRRRRRGLVAGRRRGAVWRSFSGLGLVLGAIFLAASLTPSLIPRSFPLQGVLAGVCFAVGYGLGVLCGALWATSSCRCRASGSAASLTWLAAAVAGGDRGRASPGGPPSGRTRSAVLMDMPPVETARPDRGRCCSPPWSSSLLLLLARLFRGRLPPRRAPGRPLHPGAGRAASIGIAAAVVLFAADRRRRAAARPSPRRRRFLQGPRRADRARASRRRPTRWAPAAPPR